MITRPPAAAARHRGRALLGTFGVVLVAGTYLARNVFADTPLRSRLLATDPFSRGLNYTLVRTRLVDHRLLRDRLDRRARPANSVVTRAFAAAGRTTLTLYILHVLVFNAVVDRWHLVRPAGLDVALLFAGCYWVVGDHCRCAVAAAVRDRAGGVGLPPVRRQHPGVTLDADRDAGGHSSSLNVSHWLGSPEL